MHNNLQRQIKYNTSNSASNNRQQQAAGYSGEGNYPGGGHQGGQPAPQGSNQQAFMDSKLQTLKIKNSGLRKYQRQFQSSQPALAAHNNQSGTSLNQNNSNSTQQPAKLIIQSQHGRNLKRQALGSGGVQVRAPMILQSHQPAHQQHQNSSSQSALHHPPNSSTHQQQIPPSTTMTLRSKALSLNKTGGGNMAAFGQQMHGQNSNMGAGGGASAIREGDGNVVGLRRVPIMNQGQMHQQQNTAVIAVKQNRLNKLQKHQNIQNVGGDQMSSNGSNSMGVDQDEDVPETLSDENTGMYHQMNIKDIKDAPGNNINTRDNSSAGPTQQAKAKLILKPEPTSNQLRSRFLSPPSTLKPAADLEDENAVQAKAIYHSPQNQLQNSRPLQYQSFESQNKNEEDHNLLKSECESMHKLIKELNEQAMDMLYSSNQKNVSLEGGPGSAQEYLVIQRKLSEIKQSALNEPDVRGKNSKDEDQDCSDLQKSLRTLEKALKILTIQHQKQRILVKPIYISIITYNIACCHQQTNNLKKCDKLLSQSIKLLEEDIETIDKIVSEFTVRATNIQTTNTIKKRKLQKIEERIRIGRRPQGQEMEARRKGQAGCWICSQLVDVEERSTAGCQKCIFEISQSQAVTDLTQEPAIVPCSLLYLKYTRMRQLTILLLQHCAILSQLNRHGDALGYAHSTTQILHRVSRLAIKIVQGKTNNIIEMERIQDDKERVELAVDEYLKLHKWLKNAAAEEAHAGGTNSLSQTPQDKVRPNQAVGSSSQSAHGQTSQKKERRGRNGRKPSVQVNSSAQKLTRGLNYDQSSLRGKKNSTSGIYTPLQTDNKKSEKKYPRSRSQHSRRSFSKHSDNSASSRSRQSSVARSRSTSSVLSACLSNISRKSKKNIKQINAGLERLHTFGMSNVHKGILEIQEQKKMHDQNDSNIEEDKQDGNDNNSIGKKKTIQKTMSQKKLQGAGQAQQDDNKKIKGDVGPQPKGTFLKKKQSVTPLTSLKFINPKDIQNNDGFDGLSKISSEQENDVTVEKSDVQPGANRKALAQSVCSSVEVNQIGGSLLRHTDDDGSGKLLSQSLEFKNGAKDAELQNSNQDQDDDLKLPEVLSDVNSGSVTREKVKPTTQKSKFSYYVRDQFQPLQKQKENIEKLLRQFSDHQKDFLDIIFQNQYIQDLNSSGGAIENLRGYDSGASGPLSLNLNQKQTSFSSLVIKNLKLSFQSIEEIERLKRDYNMYRQTQRNQLGISKPTKLPGEFGARRSNRLNWIDLFNIGNVMLMRGQDIQMSHKGWNEVCEFDTFDQIMQHETPKPQPVVPNSRPSSFHKASFKSKLNQRDSRNMDSASSQGSNLQPHEFDTNRFSQYESLDDMPELSIQRTNRYTISKDSFTEIVLLTVISYFCVSTEHRFINMNQDREKQQQKQTTNDNAASGSMFDLNNSNQSMPSTIRSAGIQNSGLNSTLQRSTKDRTQTSSTQRQLAARNQKNLDGGRSMQNTNSNFQSNSSVGNQKHIQSLQEKGTGLQVHQTSLENNTAGLSNLENRGSNSERFSQVDHQEYFLCKALHFGLLYLPPDSPLVQHLTQNYIKNYLQPRLQKREDLVNKFMQ